jgi:ferritin-like metal-binding protein YciE
MARTGTLHDASVDELRDTYDTEKQLRLVARARAMGHSEAAGLLQETLVEEKAADDKLSSLAEGGINQEAAEAARRFAAKSSRRR